MTNVNCKPLLVVKQVFFKTSPEQLQKLSIGIHLPKWLFVQDLWDFVCLLVAEIVSFPSQ